MTTHDTQTPEALLPCPFCGEAVEARDYRDKPAAAWVMIHRCPVIGPIKLTGYSGEVLTGDWNTRAGALVVRPDAELLSSNPVDAQIGPDAVVNAPGRIYLTDVDYEDPESPLVWASVSVDSGGVGYIRADLAHPTETSAPSVSVKPLVDALTRIQHLARMVAHDLQGRVEGGKVAAVLQCAEVAGDALASLSPLTEEASHG